MSGDPFSSNGVAELYSRIELGQHAPEKPDVDWGDDRPWPILDRAARYGLFGDIVAAIEDQTEAHPAGLLFTLLGAYGNAIGPQAHAVVADDQHPGRLFVALVGATSTGGKGTSLAAIRPFLRTADDEWWTRAGVNGFVSGEAIIAHANGSHRAADEVIDKRIFVVEPEFARLLTVNSRDGSTASPIIRQAWDGVTLQLRRSKDKMIAEGAHVSILGHVTPDELRAKLSTTEVAGGFANRFLFVCVKRVRKLPTGGYFSPEIVAIYGRRLRQAMDFARSCSIMKRSPAAAELWAEYYNAEPDRDGVLGEVTARANPQKLRLSVLYALADGRATIQPEHVIAAEAAWRYCVDSAEYIFGSIIGDSTQDKLLEAAREAYPGGLTGTQQRDLFLRHFSEEKLAIARAALEKRGLIRIEKRASTGGRPASLMIALPFDQSAERRQKAADELFGRLSSLLSHTRTENSQLVASAPTEQYDYHGTRWQPKANPAVLGAPGASRRDIDELERMMFDLVGRPVPGDASSDVIEYLCQSVFGVTIVAMNDPGPIDNVAAPEVLEPWALEIIEKSAMAKRVARQRWEPIEGESALDARKREIDHVARQTLSGSGFSVPDGATNDVIEGLFQSGLGVTIDLDDVATRSESVGKCFMLALSAADGWAA